MDRKDAKNAGAANVTNRRKGTGRRFGNGYEKGERRFKERRRGNVSVLCQKNRLNGELHLLEQHGEKKKNISVLLYFTRSK